MDREQSPVAATADVIQRAKLLRHARSKSDGTKAIFVEKLLRNSSLDLQSSHRLNKAVVPQYSYADSVSFEDDFDIQQSTLHPKGPNLLDFLATADYQTCAELERENAHFSISEALISAFEQIQAERMLAIAEQDSEEEQLIQPEFESDEEIKYLQRRIRLRRAEMQSEKHSLTAVGNLLSDGRTDTGTVTSYSPKSSPSSNFGDSDENTLASDSLDDLTRDFDGRLTINCDQFNSLEESAISAYSPSLQSTAENVALNLLENFTKTQTPNAADLDWLVSEQDVPQALLPLPPSFPVSPDGDEFDTSTRLRGNFEWAPPRPQIIFDILPDPKKKILLAKQNYFCAGCGTKVQLRDSKRMRYCNYLGKYFCRCCHRENRSLIPGRILRKWDFDLYEVSQFSEDLLRKIYFDPLFNIQDMNPTLYKKCKDLRIICDLRQRLLFLKEYIGLCKHSDKSLKDDFDRLPAYLLLDPHVYSIWDFTQVKQGVLIKNLRGLTARALDHVYNCQLCCSQGFLCELCIEAPNTKVWDAKKVIFPFQLATVVRCSKCSSCYHSSCFLLVPGGQCPKCTRVAKRRRATADGDS